MVERLSVETFRRRHESLRCLWKKYALPPLTLSSPWHPTAWWASNTVCGLCESSLLFCIWLFSLDWAVAHRLTAPKEKSVTLWLDRAEQCRKREQLPSCSATSLDMPEIYLKSHLFSSQPGTPFYVIHVTSSDSKIWQHNGVMLNRSTPKYWIWIQVGH